ncbi:MAG TPA: LysR family transcriptional regulator [Ktedonobacterales bacterium]
MTLDQLETFISIARTHSFSRAAVLLGLAQPTLSGRISALEGELGSQLFLRHGHTLEMSEAGRALLPYAERMLALRTEGISEVHRLRMGGLGRLALGANLSASQYLVPGLIELFHRQHPEVPIRVRTSTSPALMESLLDGVVQLAICSQAQIDPRAQVLWSYSDPLLLVASGSHPLARLGECSRADLAHHTILSTQAGPTRLGLRYVLPPSDETPIAIEANAGEVMTQLLRRGLGVTVLPALAIWGELARGELVSIRVRDAALPTYDVALVQWSGRSLSPAASAFAEMVRGVRVPDVLGHSA